MKRRRQPPDSRLKRRYNLCARLRLKGVEVTTDSAAIEISELDYQNLSKTALRYCIELVNDYHYVVQLLMPDRGDKQEKE